MIGGIVHQEGDTFWFADIGVRKPEDVPRRPGTVGTWYATSAVSMMSLIKLMSEGDKAFGPSPDRPLGVAFKWTGPDGREKTMRVVASSVWGVSSRDPIDTENQIVQKMMMCAQDGITPTMSAAGTALSRYMKQYDGKGGRPKTTQLPPRWRELAHASFHGGPIALTMSSHPDVVHIDMRGAYLQAMREPLPVLGEDEKGRKMGGYSTFHDADWEDVRGKTGFVEATVLVSRDQFKAGDIPPLPIRHFSGSCHPAGIIRGAWPICMVEDAAAAGEVEVLKVHQFCWSNLTMPMFADITDDFRVNRQGKLLYTRFWGKWASKGGFSGMVTDNPPNGAVRSHGIWWEHEGVDTYDHEAPPTYRPDIAALIAGYNHRQVFRAVRRLKPGSIVSLYVDAIWTSDIEGAAKIVEESGGEWVVKQRGPGRFYGPGIYHHGDRMGAAGYDPLLHGELTPERLDLWAASPLHKGQTVTNRDWSANPATTAGAVSTPLILRDGQCGPACRGPSVNDPCWTSTGWLQRELRDKIEESNLRREFEDLMS